MTGWLWLLALGAAAQEVKVATAKNGILDLRNADFQRYKYALDGEWKIYPGKLLTPAQKAELEEGFLVQYPMLWHGTYIEGERLPSRGYATYALQVILPKDIQPDDLALHMPDGYSSYKLYIDDEPFLKNGVTGKTAATTVPYFRPVTKRLHFKNDTVQILIQYANFHHQRGGPYRQLIIGNNDILKNEMEVNQAFDIFMAGCLFMGGLFFLGLFLFGTHDKAILYFSLFCLVYIYRIVGVDMYTLHGIFPNLSWFVTIRLEYISLGVSIIFFLLYTRHLYPDEVHDRFIMWTVVSSLVFIANTCLPAFWFTHLLQPYLFILVASTGYIAYVYILAARNNRPGAGYALLSTAVLILIGTILIVEYLAVLIVPKIIVLIGYVLFFFFQSLILSYRFAFVLKKSRNDALEGIKAKSSFLSTMSHEIRTPLNSVIGMANLMLTKSPRADQKMYLDTMLFSANHLLTTINDILDYNKIEAGKMTLNQDDISLCEVCSHTVDAARVLIHTKPVQVLFVCDDLLTTQKVFADKGRVVQVITNLMHNAVKFTEKGTIELRLKVIRSDAKQVTVEVSVTDTGIGIPLEKQRLIFNEFEQADSSVTREFGGTGLGLALCRKILEMQQSELRVESEVGKGARFYFTQTFAWSGSIAATQALTALPGIVEQNNLLYQRTILLAEDDLINTMVAEQLLYNMEPSLNIIATANGSEALEAYQQHQPDIVLMDVNMPIMDGLTATREIRAFEKNEGITAVPIIALTAGTLEDDAQRCMDAGMDDIVIKPFKPDHLHQCMLRLLEKKSG